MPDQSAIAIYLLHGDDEFALAQRVSVLQNSLGDAALGGLNTAVLDGRTYSLDELRNLVMALPFLVERRLVILHNPVARFERRGRGASDEETVETLADIGNKGTNASRQLFLGLLESLPQTVCLVLVENRILNDERQSTQYKRVKDHWLVEWAKKQGSRLSLEACMLPRGPMMARWVQERAASLGGRISPEGADVLSGLVGNDTRAAENELHKLLAYVNYKRQIDAEDVDLLCANISEADIFAMVDAMGNRNGRQAIHLLTRLLESQEPLSLFGMIVRQFRLLLMVREVQEQGGNDQRIAQEVKQPAWIVRKISPQARRFSRGDLEAIYRNLLDLDLGMKTGQIDGEIALNILVASVSR